jgi:hypothetical protein
MTATVDAGIVDTRSAARAYAVERARHPAGGRREQQVLEILAEDLMPFVE